MLDMALNVHDAPGKGPAPVDVYEGAADGEMADAGGDVIADVVDIAKEYADDLAARQAARAKVTME